MQPNPFAELWREASSIWDNFEKSKGFEGYVPADYQQVYDSLVKLQGTATTFLEWGSGLGVVTMMASSLGFEAYGIEVSAELVAHSETLALQYGPKAQFATGSFVPNDYAWNSSFGDEGMRTDFNASDGYEEIGMGLMDFDVVYAYPWPDEHQLFRDIMKRHGADGALFLTFDIYEGIQIHRNRVRRSR